MLKINTIIEEPIFSKDQEILFSLDNYFKVEMEFVSGGPLNKEQNLIVRKEREKVQIGIINTLDKEFGILFLHKSYHANFIIYIHISNLEIFLERYVNKEHPFIKMNTSGNKHSPRYIPCPLFDIKDLILNPKFTWTKEMIKTVVVGRRIFNQNAWYYFVKNPNFKLTMEDYLFLKDCIDFCELSSLVNFEWDLEFLHNHSDKLNWSKLSGNIGLPWNESLIDEFSDKWEWDLERGGPYYDRDLFYKNHKIFWTISMFKKYLNKLDLYTFITQANFDPNIIIEYYDIFLQTKQINNHCYKTSDDKEWEVLDLIFVVEYAQNPNFKLSKNLINFSKNKELKVMTRGSVFIFNYDATFVTQSLYDHWKSKL
jgi:hypothetical protein